MPKKGYCEEQNPPAQGGEIRASKRTSNREYPRNNRPREQAGSGDEVVGVFAQVPYGLRLRLECRIGAPCQSCDDLG